ncbi:MAG TPA: rRNA maturation RNase YbeY [Mucilaginibacter sp.]|jgi:rRNA maturation RNase YbeY
MPAIRFFEEDTTYKIKNKTALRLWITETVQTEGFKLKELTYIFCSDGYLLQLNQQYLNHDTYTDIITFDNSDSDQVIVGDIFISIDRIRENAVKFNTSEIDELHRVIIHGTLHLLGYKDKSPADKKKMTLKEDFYLIKRPFNN